MPGSSETGKFHHVVMFSFNEHVPRDHTVTLVAELQRFASGLRGLVSYACGPDAAASDTGMDFGIVAVFESEDAWREYDGAAEHGRIRAELFGPYVMHRHVIQFVG